WAEQLPGSAIDRLDLEAPLRALPAHRERARAMVPQVHRRGEGLTHPLPAPAQVVADERTRRVRLLAEIRRDVAGPLGERGHIADGRGVEDRRVDVQPQISGLSGVVGGAGPGMLARV